MQSRLFLLAISHLLLVPVSHAQTETPAPKMGYLRLWNMLPKNNGAIEVRKAGSDNPLLNGQSFQYSSYTPFAPGNYRLEVVKAGERAPLKTLEVNLKADTFFTILAAPLGGVINVEQINDTVDPKSDSGTLVIRNYFPSLTVAVVSDTKKITEGLPYGQTQSATGLPLVRLPLTLRTRLPSGTPAESSAEADFTASKRVTVLIIPDSYGRFRPRVTIDGKL